MVAAASSPWITYGSITTTLLPNSYSNRLSTLLPTPSFSSKKKLALRWRVAQARSQVNRVQNEIAALDELRPQTLATEKRIKMLRVEAGKSESQIILLKSKQSKLGFPRRNNLLGTISKNLETFLASEQRSSSVLLNLLRTSSSPWSLLLSDTQSLLKMGTSPSLLSKTIQLKSSQRLIPHAAAIGEKLRGANDDDEERGDEDVTHSAPRTFKLTRRPAPRLASLAAASRAATLEQYAPGILIAVDGYLEFVEPHLDLILERLDVIEPHIPFVLKHLEVLAPHCGVLLSNIDRLLLFADDNGKYLDPLLPWVPFFVDKIDALSPHFILLRPHFKYVLPHFDVIAPSAERFKEKLDVSR
ncbi:hypothetical protein TL16_g11834 [Triparma laevis f. inornata]|uniref:Uncharacterized protein n=1 Tax=Triparma laevis f. inornata TaxID=1714386 RepID=A0A9W7BHQ5_9STRA|nr:hypothetical protein TL16_g11834 [Triparma laevis f. inornata]